MQRESSKVKMPARRAKVAKPLSKIVDPARWLDPGRDP